MTERRSHWDASLISAVLADLRDVYDSGYGEDQAFRIIAAVEDWIDARGSAIDGREVVAAIAAVARVRELCDGADQNRPRIDGYLINRTVPVKDIRRALEGNSNE